MHEKSKMRILFFTTKFQARVSGISIVDEFLYKEMQKITDCDICYLRAIKVPLIIQNAVNKLTKKDLQGFFNNIPFIVPRCNFDNYDVIYFMNQQNTIALNWLNTGKIIVGLRDVISYSCPEDKSTSFFFKFYDWLCFRGIKRAKRIVCDSQSEKNNISEYLRYPVERIDVIHLGLEPSIFYKKQKREIKNISFFDKNCKNLLYVGTESPRKNLSTLIKAVAELKKEIPNIRLVKIGDILYEKERQKILSLIRELNLEQNILLAGYVNVDLGDYYNLADVFVFPSLMEGFGLPLLEAMACGCPVITSRRSAMPEIGRDAVMYVDNPLDHKEFAYKIKQVLNNDNLRKTMIKKGLQLSKEFRWYDNARSIYNLFMKHGESLK